MKRAFLTAVLAAGLLAAGACAPGAAQTGPQLVSSSPNAVVRFAVAHTHPADMCYGFLSFSRGEIRYQVVRPAKYSSHAFSQARSGLSAATLQPSFQLKGSVAEFSFQDRSKHSFGRVHPSAVENESAKAITLLPLQDVLEAVNKFEVLVARLEGRDPPAESAAASKPAEPKPATKPPPPAAPQPATLMITSYPPGAQVWVDDHARGPTDAHSGEMRVTRVPAGRSYRLRVSAQGYQEWTQTVAAVAGQTLAVEARLTPSGPPPFSVRDIVELLQGEVAPARVAALVAERGVDFVLSNEAEQQIRAAGGDAELLVAIVRGKK
ncbi:MAG: carboxypeptidase-like regulatory domain-containing protein [Acidobacteria bacterium]|nr:carboxypeptidase-like regulatory domain-containing protein [Acidobacteriota bacterium]